MTVSIQPPKDYVDFYRRLAIEDIRADIVPAYYKNAQRDKLIKRCGNTDGKLVLEIGIGKDPLLCHLKGCSRRVAVDIAEEYLDRLPPDVTAWQGFAEDMPFKDAFDLVICSDVLEHVLSSSRLLSAIHRAVKRGGRVVIKTPYKEDLSQYVGNKWEGCHLRTFDDDSLDRLLVDSGLTPVAFYHSGYDCTVHVLPQVNRYFNYSFAVTKFLPKAQRVVCRLPDWLPPLMGYKPIEITVVAEKR